MYIAQQPGHFFRNLSVLALSSFVSLSPLTPFYVPWSMNFWCNAAVRSESFWNIVTWLGAWFCFSQSTVLQIRCIRTHTQNANPPSKSRRAPRIATQAVCLFVTLYVVLHALVVAKLKRREGESPSFLESWSDEYRVNSFLPVVTNEQKKNEIIWLQHRAAMQLIKLATKLQRKYKQLSTVYIFELILTFPFCWCLSIHLFYGLSLWFLPFCTRTMTCSILFFSSLVGVMGLLLVPFVCLENTFKKKRRCGAIMVIPAPGSNNNTKQQK